MSLIAVVVDDNEMDRYLVRRVLSKREEFGKILEAKSGDALLNEICATGELGERIPKPVLILMDINMPGLNGFETAERLNQLVEDGKTPGGIVVMMFTSSDNPADRDRAEQIPIVQGYIVKPLNNEDIDCLLSLYPEGL